MGRAPEVSLTGLAFALALAQAEAKKEPSSTSQPSTSTSQPSSSSSQPSSQPPLQQAEEALRAGIHKRCVELAQDALATGALEEDGVARAWWTRGRCHSIDNDPDRAERSYAVAVRVKPTLLMPLDDTAWKKVAAEGTATDTALTLRAATAVVEDGAVGIVVVDVMAQDDLGLGRGIALVDAAGVELARAPIERKEGATGDAWVKVQHRFSGIPVDGVSARLLDKHGNVLRRASVVIDDASKAALAAAGATVPHTTAPSTSTPAPLSALSYIGGGVVALGIVGGAASAIALSLGQAEQQTGLVEQAPLLLGVGAGVGAVVVGAALVVVDQR
jgi:hypothetical protein